MNRIKLLILILLASVSGSEVFSQTLKTHKGELAGGTETYQYYIDQSSGEEIRQGTYSYSKEEHNSEGASSVQTIKGTYAKGYKDGAWVYTFKQVDVANGYNNYITATTTMTMTYKDGMPNGVWKYSRTGKHRSRNYSLLGWSWGNYVSIDPTHISTAFSNGVMVGDVTYKTPWVDVKGKLDGEGWHTGIWRIDKQGTTINFINGIALYEPKDQKLTGLQRKIASLPPNEREAFCLENRLSMKLMPSSNFFDINDGYFDNSMWLHRAIGGDKTYTTEDGLNYKDSKNYGQYYFVDYVKMVNYSSVISTNMTSDEMQKALDENRVRLDDENVGIVEKMIAEKKTEEDAKRAAEQKNPELFNQLLAGRADMIALYNRAKNCKLELSQTPQYEEWDMYIAPVLKNYLSAIKFSGYYRRAQKGLSSISSTYLSASPIEYVKHLDYEEKMTSYNTAYAELGLYISSYERLNKLANEIVSYFNTFPKKYTMIRHSKHLKSLLIYRNVKLQKVLIENRDIYKEDGVLQLINNAIHITEMCHNIDSLSNKFESIKTNKKLLKEFSEMEKHITITLSEAWDDSLLEQLDSVAKKVDSLLGADTKSIEKSLSKEKSIDSKIRILLGE